MQTKYKVLGIMSGTSLDGLDLAFCHFELQDTNTWKFELIAADTISYTEKWSSQLEQSMQLSALELAKLHNTFGYFIGTEAARFLSKHQLAADLIASHGHTVFHQPEEGLTLQIGSGQHIAMASQVPVVCDFRSLDVLLGGQGAPLVPIGDRLLFGEYDCCLNLGGISNISFEKAGQRVAFDIGPANMLLNYLSRKIGLPYDKDGVLAAQGKLDMALFESLNQLPYFKQPYPKSLGKEWFDEAVVPLLEHNHSSVEDQLHTAVRHISFQLKQSLSNVLKDAPSLSLLITGGGGLNTFLIATIQKELGSQIQVFIPEENIIAFKEAIVFGFLGVLRLRNEINTLHTVTGASRSQSAGSVYRVEI